jgi:hypothetical protein
MERRSSDGAKARTEYETAARGVGEKTARLRALRLAKLEPSWDPQISNVKIDMI